MDIKFTSWTESGDGGGFSYERSTPVTEFFWDGSTDSDWDTGENWETGFVPSIHHDVTIPDVTNDPVISSTGTASCKNLTIESEASLTIASDESGTGSLITTGTITNNGTVNIQRYLTEDVWHLISVPDNVSTANTFMGDYLQTWDETTATWDDVSEPTTALIPVQGYGFWGTPGKATTYTFTGTPNTGDQNLAITYTDVPANDFDGANLLGNPYSSSIDWSGLDDSWGAVYYYNGNAYVSWNAGSGDGSQYVPPMQGFFIVANEAGTFELTNENRVHSGQAYYKSQKGNSLVLETASKDYSDKLFVRFDASATSAFDLQTDAYKFMSGTEALSELYSFAGDKALSIDVRPKCEVIQLGFRNTESGTYNIGISELADISEAILEDTKTNTFHKLISIGSYEFVWDLNDNEKRFKLHLITLGVEESIPPANNILVYSSGNSIYVKGADAGRLIVSDITGRQVMEVNITGNDLNTIPINLETGLYIVSIINGDQITTEKIYIN